MVVIEGKCHRASQGLLCRTNRQAETMHFTFSQPDSLYCANYQPLLSLLHLEHKE